MNDNAIDRQKLTAFLEIPLALLSFLFYKVMKFMIGTLYTIYLKTNKKNACQWRVLSAENLQSPLSLPVLMTKGPRWNTHAIIGTLGPFEVQESLAIDAEIANRSAQSWIAVIYSFPSYQTVTSIESNQLTSQEKWATLNLKSGRYSIGLRYYHWSESVSLPAIKVDGKIFVNSQSVTSNNNDFYYDLIKQKNWFYSSLHYYIFTVLRLRKWLPESFIRNEYLPVGAPDTQFLYGYLLRGQILEIKTITSVINNNNLYLTIYDRASLPVSWSQIKEEKYVSKPIESNGFYLIRIRPQSHLRQASTTNSSLKSEVEGENSLVQQLKIYV